MTSKSLFFNLLKEHIKKNIWIVALSFLAFFFSYPVAGSYSMGSVAENYSDINVIKMEQQLVAENWLGFFNHFTVFLILMAAIVCGVSTFSYLHKKKQLDFYHSLPVSRNMLFLIHYMVGFLAVAIPYVINLVLTLIVFGIYGVGLAPLFGICIATCLFHLVFYLLIYSTVVVAMVMTGNKVVGILGSLVFFAYVPAVISLWELCHQIFFRSYRSGAVPVDIRPYSSPVGYYMIRSNQLAYGTQENDLWLNLLITFAVVVLITGLGMWLNRKRPSEAAGKAMAFSVTKTAIKCLLVVPFALAGAIYFYMFRDSDGWAVFGLLCGLLISYGVIEIIYHFEFRKLFSHKIHLAGCLFVSTAIFCVFRFDLLGYDTYLPKVDQVKHASIYFDNLEQWVEYDKPEQNGVWDWKSVRGVDYAEAHMQLTDITDVRTIAEQGIQEIEKEKNKNVMADESISTENLYRQYQWVTIQYQLKSGRSVSRSYRVDMMNVKEAMENILDSDAYKIGVYPVFERSPEQIAGVYYREAEGYRKKVEVDQIEQDQLLAAYKKDLLSLSVAERRTEIPIALIQFRTQDHQAIIDSVHQDFSNRKTRYQEMDFYPIYPSFTETIELLRKSQIEAGDMVTVDEIHSYTVELPRTRAQETGGYGNRTIVVTERDQIETLFPLLLSETYLSYNALFPYSDSWISTSLERDGELITYYYKLPYENVPAFLSEE